DVASQIKAVTEHGLDPRHFILCTDDCHSGTLVHDGHMNRVVRHAIEQGLKPMTAIQMATINTAQHFGMERDIGSIAPGRLADVLIVSELPAMKIDQVYGRGQLLAEDGRLVADIPAYSYPERAKSTVKLGKSLSASDFDIEAPRGAETVRARVIGVIENQAPTRALEAALSVTRGVVQMSSVDDICQIALVERHRGTGAVVNGFVSGFGYDSSCAMASTVAHDSHQMIVVGTSKTGMAKAANRLGDVGGGVVFFQDGEEKALIDLPIAGLMSERRAEVVAEQAEQLGRAMLQAGCTLNNAYMQHSLLALVVIPQIRISDLGIVDVTKFETVDLFV
ncbi:MAG: adenine deaminase C-terminal domain-containing protein, partial [Pseudomonadota bacterium]